MDDGWDDEIEIIDDLSSSPSSPNPHVNASLPAHTYTNNNDNNSDSQLAQELRDYIDSLPHLVNSLQALLEAEYNTEEKALELLQYYHDRPNLAQYTIDKEIPRMQYVLQIDNRTINDKTVIADFLRKQSRQNKKNSDNSSVATLARCANQSLLADVLQVLTGPDRVVRPQYFSNAIATSCSFRLQPQTDTVQVQALFDLSLPMLKSKRWTIAQLQAHVHFVTNYEHAFVTYQVQMMNFVQSNSVEWQQNFNDCLSCLEELHASHPDHDMFYDNNDFTNAEDRDFRDVFLQKTQNMWLQSSAGIKSAWQEIDNVAGLSSKIKKLPGLLPEIPVDVEDDVYSETHKTTASTIPTKRPTSILGGWVRSGISQLAKTVTLPEEDPSLYQEWQAPVNTQLFPQPQALSVPIQSSTNAPNIQNTKTNSVQTPSNRHKHQEQPLPRPQPPPAPPLSDPSLVNNAHKLSRSAKTSSSTTLEEISEATETHVQSVAAEVTVNGNDNISLPKQLSETIKNEIHDLEPPKNESDSQTNNIGDLHHSIDATNSPEAKNISAPKSRREALLQSIMDNDWEYNPDDNNDGIMPTRRRWVNPIPGLRRLRPTTNSQV